MVKRCVVAGFFCLACFWPRPALAQSGGLTMPGAMPTLAPLSAPLNSLTFPQTNMQAVAPTAAPTVAAAKKPVKAASFSVTKTITPYIGAAYKTLSEMISRMKLDGVTKALLLELLRKTLELIKSYNTQADPLIRKFLVQTAARLPDSIRGFTSVFIPFLTMAGKVILGVIAGIIALKLLLFLLGRLLGSLFRPKKRRR